MANSNQTHHSLKTDEPMDTDSPCNNENLRAHNSSITDGHIFIPEETMDTDSARMVSEHGSGHSAVSDRMTTETTLVSEPGNGEERDQEEQYSSTDKDSSRRNGEERDQEEQYSSTDKDSSRRNGEERDQEKHYSSADKHSSQSGGRGFFQGICVKGYNFISGNKNDTSSSPDATKEYDHEKQGSSKVKMPKPPQPCFECDIKDEEIKRLRNQTYQFMMEIELHLEGRDMKRLSLEYEDLFNDQTQKVADIVKSEILPCKLFQACYDVVHKTVIELCGTHIECLFKVYDDTAIPADMKDIKNEKCRCYIKLVSTFKMNQDKECTLEDLKGRLEQHLKEHFPELTIKHPQLERFLTESLKLSWKLATCVPPMIVTCDQRHYDTKMHSRISVKEEVPDKHTLEYHSPTLYTNYTGHVEAKGQVEIISDSVSETNQPLPSITGPEKPSLELVIEEVSDEFKDVVTLRKFAHALGMPQNKIDRVFNVAGAEIKDNLHQIITWWLNRRRIEPEWDKLADAVEITRNNMLVSRIRQKYCESRTAK